MSCRSATARQLSIAAGVVPQSSCSFRPQAPASTCSSSARGWLRVALAHEAEVHRKGLGRLQHRMDVPRPGRAGGREGAGRRAGAAAEHRRHAAGQRLLDLLRADEVDVRIDAAGGDDHPFAGDDLGARADDDVDARLDVGIAGLAEPGDASGLDRDVGLDDAPVVEHQRIGDDGVGHVRRGRAGSGPCRRGWSCRRRTSPPRRSRRRAGCSRPRPRSPGRCRRGARGRRRWGRTSRHRRVLRSWPSVSLMCRGDGRPRARAAPSAHVPRRQPAAAFSSFTSLRGHPMPEAFGAGRKAACGGGSGRWGALRSEVRRRAAAQPRIGGHERSRAPRRPDPSIARTHAQSFPPTSPRNP